MTKHTTGNTAEKQKTHTGNKEQDKKKGCKCNPNATIVSEKQVEEDIEMINPDKNSMGSRG